MYVMLIDKLLSTVLTFVFRLLCTTAFANFDSEEVKEEVYHDTKDNPAELVEFIERLDEDAVKNMLKQ